MLEVGTLVSEVNIFGGIGVFQVPPVGRNARRRILIYRSGYHGFAI